MSVNEAKCAQRSLNKFKGTRIMTFLLLAVWIALYGYFPKPTKSYLIVKEKKMMEAQNLFANSRVDITAEGKRHLGAVIGST